MSQSLLANDTTGMSTASAVFIIDETVVDLSASEMNFTTGDGGDDHLTVAVVTLERPSSPGSMSQDSCHNSQHSQEESGELDVRVVTTKDLLHRSSSYMTEMPSYKMESKPRGLALIIEIEKYVNDVQERRIGSHHDVDNLQRLFEQLYFTVEVRCNPGRREFDQILGRFAQDAAHESADMMILAVLSHGHNGQVYTADGRNYETERIYERFNNLNCPALKGKPKFFIVQACRGDETDTGQKLEEDETMANMNPRKRRAGTDRDTIPFGKYAEMNRARPTWEDMIIAYSTIPGFTSIRDHEKGTWFIMSLVEVFMNHAFERELIDLLRMTSERLSKFTNENNEKQTCNVELRHLYKQIYFNPGIHTT